MIDVFIIKFDGCSRPSFAPRQALWVFRDIQSANAGKDQAPLDSQGERQKHEEDSGL